MKVMSPPVNTHNGLNPASTLEQSLGNACEVNIFDGLVESLAFGSGTALSQICFPHISTSSTFFTSAQLSVNLGFRRYVRHRLTM